MSPAVIGRFPGYAQLFGGKQRARSLHFIGLCLFAGFIVMHTVMVIINGLPNLWTVMVLGHREHPPYTDQGLAVAIGLTGLFGILLLNVVATLVSLRYRRFVQRSLGIVVDPFERLLSRAFISRQHYAWPTSPRTTGSTAIPHPTTTTGPWLRTVSASTASKSPAWSSIRSA